MRSILVSSVVAGAVAIAVPAAAFADGPAWATGERVCIMGSFAACVSFEGFSYDAGTRTLSFRLVNLAGTAGDYHNVTSFGFYRNGSTWGGTITAFSGPSGWSPVPPCPSGTYNANCSEVWNNGSGSRIEFGSDADGIGSAIGPNGFGDFSITLSEAFIFDEQTQVRWHTQDVGYRSSDISFKCDTGWNDASDPDSSYPPCTVVPEPITVVLLGSGLAGLGGVGILRRRKRA